MSFVSVVYYDNHTTGVHFNLNCPLGKLDRLYFDIWTNYSILWFYLFILITTLQHQLISHNISFVLRVLFWTRHLQSPNKHVISHLIPAQRSVDRIADQTWWLIYRGYQTEWGAEFGKRSPSSQCSFLKWSLTALSHGLPPTPTGWTLSNHL